MSLPKLPKTEFTNMLHQRRAVGNLYSADQMRDYAMQAVLAEREACARVCEAEANQWRGRDSDAYAAVWDCAHAILARAG